MMHRTADDPAAIFAALGDDTRLELVARLSRLGDASISELTAGFGMTRQGVTKHLGVLEQAGVVTRRRAGRERRVAIRSDALNAARHYLAAASAQWDQTVARLRTIVEN